MTTKATKQQPARWQAFFVVDDEPRMINFIRMNLELEGHQVVEAHNGLEALEAVRTKLPDIVLLDVMMPELDGFETLRMLREFSTIPVIMLTAKGEENDKVYGLELGADDYIPKPFGPRELSSRIKAVLRRADMPSASPSQSILKIDDRPERRFQPARGDRQRRAYQAATDRVPPALSNTYVSSWPPPPPPPPPPHNLEFSTLRTSMA